MNNEGDPSPRPRRIVHDAQEHAFRWHELCLRVHHGVGDVDPEVAQRMYHTAVFSLWRQLERFRDNQTARELWTEPIFYQPVAEDPRLSELLDLADSIANDGGEDLTLGEISELLKDDRNSLAVSLENLGEHYHLRADTRDPTVENPEGSQVARVLSVANSFAVHRQLDDVAHTIGFDADLPDPIATPDEAQV